MIPYNLMKGINPQVVIDRLTQWVLANKCRDSYYALTVTLHPDAHKATSATQAKYLHDTVVKETLPHNRYFFSQEFTENGIIHAHAILTDHRGIKSFVNRIRRNLNIGYCKLKKVFTLQKWTEYMTKSISETLLEFSDSDFNYIKYFGQHGQTEKMDYSRLEKDYTNIINMLYFSQDSTTPVMVEELTL